MKLFKMVLDQFAAALIGAVIGWTVVFALRTHSPVWKKIIGIIVLLIGGSELTYVISGGLIYDWLGIFAGFFAGIFWIGIIAGFGINIILEWIFIDSISSEST